MKQTSFHSPREIVLNRILFEFAFFSNLINRQTNLVKKKSFIPL